MIILFTIYKKKFYKKYDAIYALDVIEHIKRSQCSKFINNIKNSIKPRGILIIGCQVKAHKSMQVNIQKNFTLIVLKRSITKLAE